MSNDYAITATNIAKTVTSGQTTLSILADLELAVPAGERLAIVGMSGSGKSTLLAILAGLDQPTAGHIELLGRDLTGLDEDDRAAWRAGRIGFVFQSFQLMDGLSAEANVLLALELAGVARGPARERARELLAAVGLGDRSQHTPRQLSGGEQQRVALARAFASQPALLFADEPTGNLDRETGQRVIDLLFDLNQRTGTTLILVTHDESLAARCDRCLRLVDGRLVERS